MSDKSKIKSGSKLANDLYMKISFYNIFILTDDKLLNNYRISILFLQIKIHVLKSFNKMRSF
jgi:hypothetical protein